MRDDSVGVGRSSEIYLRPTVPATHSVVRRSCVVSWEPAKRRYLTRSPLRTSGDKIKGEPRLRPLPRPTVVSRLPASALTPASGFLPRTKIPRPSGSLPLLCATLSWGTSPEPHLHNPVPTPIPHAYPLRLFLTSIPHAYCPHLFPAPIPHAYSPRLSSRRRSPGLGMDGRGRRHLGSRTDTGLRQHPCHRRGSSEGPFGNSSVSQSRLLVCIQKLVLGPKSRSITF